MNWGEMYPQSLDAKTADQLMQPKTLAPADTGIWQNFGSGTGSYLMRSFAEMGRAASMLAIGAESLTPSSMAMRALTPDAFQAKQDAEFQTHDELFQGAIDHWTPKANTVGKAAEIVGQLGGGALQFAINPALAVATQQMSTSIDLTREGVDPGAALLAGDVAGIGTAVGVKLPFLGSTFARKAASGAAGNLVQGVATAGATNLLLKAADRPDQAAKFDPFDPSARALDVLLGVAFGGIAHLQERAQMRLDADQKAALLTVNQARHLEQSAAPDMTAPELTQHVTEVQRAVEQLLRGEQVTAGDGIGRPPAGQVEVTAELQRLATDMGPPPDVIQRPAMSVEAAPVDGTAPPRPAGENIDPRAVEAQRVLTQAPDLMLDTGNVLPDGSPERVPAADYVARAEAELAQAKSHDSNLFRVAAECLLGAL